MEKMEKRNTVLLTVIGLATLLVAVIGATFAYFTAQVTSSGASASQDVTTVTLGGTTLTFESAAKNFSYLNYPGGLGVIGSNVVFKKEATSGKPDSNTYMATYDLELNVTNPTKTDMKWALYVYDQSDIEESLDPGCVVQSQADAAGNTYFWYGNSSTSTTTHAAEEYKTGKCSFPDTVVGESGSLKESNKIAEGYLCAGASSEKINASSTVNGKQCGETQGHYTITKVGGYKGNEGNHLAGVDETYPLKGRTLTTTQGAEGAKYYYLVVEYPNESSSQNEDFGKTVTVTLTAVNAQVSYFE